MLKIYYSSLNSISAEGLLASLKNRDKNKKHIIITPDRASLNYEQKLFSILEEGSFFDIQTTTLSRFCNSIIKKSGLTQKVLSKMSGVAIVKKILLEQKNNLVAFKRNVEFKNFAGDIYDILCMFKSNNLVPTAQLAEGLTDNLKLKLSDLALIYNEYEKYLKNEFTDSFNRLNLCRELISKEMLGDTNIYFVQFDDYTKQAYAIIEKLIKCANSVSVSTTFARTSQARHNANIFCNNVYFDLISLAKFAHEEYELIEVKNTLTGEFLHLNNNAFGYKCEKYQSLSSAIKILQFDTFEQELKGVLSKIKYEIYNGARFNEYCVLIPNLNERKKVVQKVFNKFEIPYFLDSSENLKDNVIARYILNVIDLLIKINKNAVINLLKCPFSEADITEVLQYENLVNKFGVQGNALLKSDFLSVKTELVKYDLLFSELSGKHLICEFVDGLFNFFANTDFENKLNNLAKIYFDKGDVLEYRKLETIKLKVVQVMQELKNVMGDYVCSAKFFYEILESYFESVNVSLPPILADSVFVGDVQNSACNGYAHMYICSANEGELPLFANDDGIITDADINLIGLNKINPTVKFVNKKNKFKLFETLFNAKKSLTFTYHSKNENSVSYPSSFVVDIARFMNIDIVNAGLNFNQIENVKLGLDKQNILVNNLNKITSLEGLIEIIKLRDVYGMNKNYVTLVSSLKQSVDEEIINNYNFKNIINNIDGSVFFKRDKVGVSEFESFYKCPYMHFVDYGLKLKQKEEGNVRPLEIGNIIHEFLKIAIPRLMQSEENVEGLAHEILENILSAEQYAFVLKNKQNNFAIKALRAECIRICNAFIYTNKHMAYKPKYFEKPFSNTDIIDVKKINKNLTLIGVIDRIDVLDNMFNVIDYKTGNANFDSFTEVYYGKKMQLIVYLMSFSDNKLYIPTGAFYLPITNNFENEDKKNSYKLKGVVSKNVDFTNFDDRLTLPKFNSDIISIGTNKDGEIKQKNNFYTNQCLTEEEFKILFDFVKEMINNGAFKITEGCIEPKPLKNGNRAECTHCLYKGMCGFNCAHGNEYVDMHTKPNIASLQEEE